MNNDNMWWEADGEELASSVFGYVKRLENEQSYISDSNYKNMRLYGNIEPYALRGFSGMRVEQNGAVAHRVTLNIVQSMVDTVVSKITKNKPRVTFLTDGGEWDQQTRAKKLTQFIDGAFEAVDFYAKAAVAFKDSCINGTGAVKVYRDGADIKAERVFIEELIVDDAEAVYGAPRQMHQKKYVHKDVLMAAFPDSADKIEMATSTETSAHASNTFDKNTNMLLVIESWHLPSGKNAKDGKHTISASNCVLFEEEYTKDYFPFVFWRWNLRPLGFWGQGIAEQLTGLQLEINKILRTIQISMHLVSVPKIFVEASAQIVSAHLNNKIGGIVKYVGEKPIPGQLGMIPPELFTHLDRLYQRAYEVIGISQLSATAQKPAGLDSGKALRTYNDIETERFMEVGLRYQRTFLDAAKIMIDLMRDIEADDSLEDKYKLKIKGQRYLKTIKWSEVSLDDDMYVMQMFPTSSLAIDPAGRMRDVQELIAAGFIGKEDGMKLLDFPDLRQFMNFNNAGIEDIERTIELIMDEGEYQTPEPYQNLQLGITKFQQAYLLYKSMGAPEDKLELLTRWLEDAANLLAKAQQQPQTLVAPPDQTDQAISEVTGQVPLPQDANMAGPEMMPANPGANPQNI